MEILPLSHKDSSEIDWQCPQKYRPSVAFGWIRGDDGKEFILVKSIPTGMWLMGDGMGPATVLPRSDQMKVERLMAPNVAALQRAARNPIIKREDDDE